MHKHRLTARVVNQANRFLSAFDDDVGNDNLGTFTRIGQSRLPAYARPAASDQRHFALNQSCHVSLLIGGDTINKMSHR